MEAMSAPRCHKVIGPELSLLASQAATAIDRVIVGKDAQVDVVKHLADFLKDTVEPPSGQAPDHMFVMPGTLEVFDNALSRSRTGDPISTVEDLAQEARGVIENLRESVTAQNNDELPALRDFCAALSIATSNYLMRMRTMRPVHPNRR